MEAASFDHLFFTIDLYFDPFKDSFVVDMIVFIVFGKTLWTKTKNIFGKCLNHLTLSASIIKSQEPLLKTQLEFSRGLTNLDQYPISWMLLLCTRPIPLKLHSKLRNPDVSRLPIITDQNIGGTEKPAARQRSALREPV